MKFFFQDVSWRLAILLLPWQIRWFSEGSMVNGYPWEQGRISIYAAWIPMLVMIIATFLHGMSVRGVSNDKIEKATTQQSSKFLFFIGIVLLLIPSFFTISIRATVQWWMQWLILIGFGWSLLSRGISSRSIAKWFLASLVPHLFLGIHQYLVQFVYGSKWLGIATQSPLDKGVSIVQVGDQRILRAYGGFPHPNIFGGWMVMGMMIALSLWNEVKKRSRYFLGVYLTLSSIVLILTFSRSAWIACLVGLFVFSISIILTHARIQRKQIFIPLIIVLFFLGSTAFIVRDKIFVRLQPTQTRLEVKSVNERQEAIKNGWELFKQHPWKGSGPGTTILALLRLPNNDPKVPPVPPHLVPLMVLDELGILGAVGFFLIVLGLYRTYFCLIDSSLLLAFLTPQLFLDHFLWSVWSGMVMFFLLFLFIRKA